MKKQLFLIILTGLLCAPTTKPENRIASVAESAGFGLALGYATGLVPPLGIVFAVPTTATPVSTIVNEVTFGSCLDTYTA